MAAGSIDTMSTTSPCKNDTEVPEMMSSKQGTTAITASTDPRPLCTISRKRKRTSAAVSQVQISEFQESQDSLRINVSELAACAGFHPFKSLPQLFLGHIYQGRLGQAMLQQDAALLQLQLVDEEQVWKDLAQKAGTSTQKALQNALEIQRGTKQVQTVEEAEQARKKVLKEAQNSGKLTKTQVATLQEGARQSIHTGFGTSWEDRALDLYEKQCGWQVNHRNAEVRVWDFDREGKECRPPYAATYPTYHDLENEVISIDDDERDSEALTGSSEKDSHKEPEVVDLSTSPDKTDQPQESKPRFSLRGSVDGIREELAPTATKTREDDDSWEFRSVVVECKHRMRKIQKTPPIYELIQATVYCLMYQTEEADLIQVLRKQRNRQMSTKSNDPKKKQGSTADRDNKITKYMEKDSAVETKRSIPGANRKQGGLSVKTDNKDNLKMETPAVEAKSGNHDNVTAGTLAVDVKKPNGLEKVNGTEPVSKEDELELEISVHRVSIDDPIFHHRQNWQSVVLPRLNAWATAVYALRKDDGKRYQLLNHLAAENLAAAWEILFNECSWLKDCQTSYHRDIAAIS